MSGCRILPTLLLGVFATAAAHAELPPPRPEATPSQSLVCFAIDQQAVGPGMTPRQAIVSRMVEGLVCAVTGKAAPAEAWRSLV